MRENLALYMIGAYAIAFFIGGYVWKSIREERKRRNINHLADVFKIHANDHTRDHGEQKTKDRPVATATR